MPPVPAFRLTKLLGAVRADVNWAPGWRRILLGPLGFCRTTTSVHARLAEEASVSVMSPVCAASPKVIPPGAIRRPSAAFDRLTPATKLLTPPILIGRD